MTTQISFTSGALKTEEAVREKVWTRDELVKVSEETQKWVDKGLYMTPSNTKIHLRSGRELSEQSKRYVCRPVDSSLTPKYDQMRVVIQERDCLDVAQELVQDGMKTMVLLFSGPESAGGGYEDGRGNGQEENIIIRSDLRGFMKFQDEEIILDTAREKSNQQSLFPIFENHLIVTPGVTVFRESKARCYALSDKPFQIGILVSAARNLNGLQEREKGHYKQTKDGIVYAQSQVQDEVELIIKNQLLRAFEAGYEALILGPFGCGAFGHPPQAVASLYRKVIDHYFARAFKTIIFAILDDGRRGPHNPIGNVEPFRSNFTS